jgi:hypothetical protein
MPNRLRMCCDERGTLEMKNPAILWRNPFFGVLLLVLLSSACAFFTPATTPLDEAEKKWQAKGIRSYTIEVLEVHSIWYAQTQKIVVVDNKVSASSASCTPAPMEGQTCKLRDFDPSAYTVEGLFARARAELKSPDAKWLKISYDSDYNYPLTIAFDDPKILDEDWLWSVKKFEVQK